MASQLGPRLAHVHLGDGTKAGLPDEHLVPGRGTQPCAELLSLLYTTGYQGLVVLEVNTHRALDVAQREADLAASLEFARKYLGGAPPPPRAADPATDEAATDDAAPGTTAPDHQAPGTTAQDTTAPGTTAQDTTGAPGWR
jgi:hypothetical protein